ncbi:hypothetical protein FGG08_006928 [Glutinoglossum americanum]|uniref:Glycoside hydrolase family 2 catalytic domain-containing protein n=1 Tax=Glutinoglossum americanum TaxID=1670608 RepID=A0A9P8I2G7_9PEZI|nr:hypothetical protein FGG08_006928 [Glutinoglossum americanum]
MIELPPSCVRVERSRARRAVAAALRRRRLQGDGQPTLVTEFGGTAVGGAEGWGYETAKTEDDLLSICADQVGALIDGEIVQGFCYTQLTDIEQEVNGLLTYDRRHKLDPEKARSITARRAK